VREWTGANAVNARSTDVTAHVINCALFTQRQMALCTHPQKGNSLHLIYGRHLICSPVAGNGNGVDHCGKL